MILTAILVSLVLKSSWANRGEVINFPTPVSTSNYVIMANHDMTAISREFSICVWLRPAVLGSSSYIGIFSYATSSDDNTILINPTHVWVHNYYAYLARPLEVDVWSHLCLTWDYESSTVYGYVNGTLGGSSTHSTLQRLIPSGGTIVLGQDQDSVGGGFDNNQAYGGEIYNLNVLDKRLTDSEVEALYNQGFCGSGVNEDFSDRIVVSWEEFIGAPRYGDVTILPNQCVLDLQSKLAEKEKLLNDTLEKLRDTILELNSTKIELSTKIVELNSTQLQLKTKTGTLDSTLVELNSTQQELAQMRLNSSSCPQELTETELKLTNCLEKMAKPVSHWDILFNQEYLNKKLTEARLKALKDGWKPIEDFMSANITITEAVIRHFKTYHAEKDTTCACDCETENN